MVLKFCLPAIDHALGTASRLAVSGSQGTRRRSLPRRAARRYIAIPGAPRGRLSRPPRFLHILCRQAIESIRSPNLSLPLLHPYSEPLIFLFCLSDFTALRARARHFPWLYPLPHLGAHLLPPLTAPQHTRARPIRLRWAARAAMIRLEIQNADHPHMTHCYGLSPAYELRV